MDSKEKFVRNVRILMAIKKWNQAQLAEKSGLSENSISRIMSGGNRQIRWITLDKIARAFNMSSSDLLSDLEFTSAEEQKKAHAIA